MRDGAGLVIYAQDDSSTLSYGILLSLTLGEKKGFGVVEETQQNRFTKGIEFGGVQRRFATEDEEGVTLLRAGNDSLLNLHTLGAGKVVYYGILEGASDFMFNPGYPVLWVKLVSYLGNLMTLADLNREGGSVMTFPEKVLVETPSGTLHASAIVFHEPGLYTVNGQKIAINLLSEEESRLDPAVSLVSGGAYEQGEQGIRQRLDSALVLGALVLLFLELLMTKFRGEI